METKRLAQGVGRAFSTTLFRTSRVAQSTNIKYLYVPAQRPKFSAFTHSGVEECQAKEHFLELCGT